MAHTERCRTSRRSWGCGLGRDGRPPPCPTRWPAAEASVEHGFERAAADDEEQGHEKMRKGEGNRVGGSDAPEGVQTHQKRRSCRRQWRWCDLELEQPGGDFVRVWEGKRGGGDGVYIGGARDRIPQEKDRIDPIWIQLEFGRIVFVFYTMEKMMTSGARSSAREERRWAAVGPKQRARGRERVHAVGFGPVGLSPLFF